MVSIPAQSLHHGPSFCRKQSYGYGGSYSGGGGYGGGGGWGGGGGGYGEDKMSNLGGGLRSIDWASTRLQHFEKNFYVEDKRVTQRSQKEVDDYMRSKEMKVRCVIDCPLVRYSSPVRHQAVPFLDPSHRSTKLGSLTIS